MDILAQAQQAELYMLLLVLPRRYTSYLFKSTIKLSVVIVPNLACDFINFHICGIHQLYCFSNAHRAQIIAESFTCLLTKQGAEIVWMQIQSMSDFAQTYIIAKIILNIYFCLM